MSKTLLVVSHSRTGSTAALVDALVAGARDDAIEGVEVVVRSALDPDVSAVRDADGIALATPANFGYMSGALKYFFDEIFYELGDDTQGLPYVLVVKGRNDTAGAVRAVEAITTGLGWKQARPAFEVTGALSDEDLEAAWELGATFALEVAEGMV